MEITLLYSIIAGLLSVLIAIVGWTGNRVIQRIDELSKSIDRVGGEMHSKLHVHEHRITKAEVQIEVLTNEIFR